jgi:hypothetical protein
MLRFLDRFELWGTLKSVAKTGNKPRYVAVGFVGRDAANLLPIGKGDVLVCPLTENNAKHGSVCPATLRVLQTRGVKIYLQDDLHAKVFLFGTKSIVGSPNLSKNSKNDLDEAALMTSDAKTARRLREWFEERMDVPLTPEWLTRCEKVYRPPEFERRIGRRNGRPKQSVWLVNVQPMDFPEAEKAAFRQGETKARAELEHKRGYGVESIRWAGRPKFLDSIRKGDLVVQIWEEANGRFEVCPHGRLLNIKPTKSRLGTPVTYIYLELPKDYRRFQWVRFKRECRKVGLTVRHSRTRRITDIVQARRILRIVSPERLAR